ncbi:SH3 domain-containing protein [Streptomyces niveus]|uniref:SH3 domain-containing protein n=1 Tax=Streptomyces niveus TaxID=193462 RepID=UPI00342EBA62
MRSLLRLSAVRAAVTAASLAALAGGGLALAPSANAVGCETNITNHWRTVTDLAGGNVRTGPGETYRKLYNLEFSGHYLAVCKTVNRHGNTWYYGKDDRGRKGWMWSEYTAKGRF